MRGSNRQSTFGQQAEQVHGDVRIGAMTCHQASGQPVHAGCSGRRSRTRSGSRGPESGLLPSAREWLSAWLRSLDDRDGVSGGIRRFPRCAEFSWPINSSSAGTRDGSSGADMLAAARAPPAAPALSPGAPPSNTRTADAVRGRRGGGGERNRSSSTLYTATQYSLSISTLVRALDPGVSPVAVPGAASPRRAGGAGDARLLLLLIDLCSRRL